MTRDEIVTALRCCGGDSCEGCPCDEIFAVDDAKCIGEAMGYAADLIENQQRHIEALMKANDSLKDAIARRDKQIEDMKQGMAQLAKAVAVKEEQK
jgi:ABC-type transporter Mla subunit MlaD